MKNERISDERLAELAALKITPGPWLVGAASGGWNCVRENSHAGQIVCGPQGLNNDNNWRLLAAAPDLLAALPAGFTPGLVDGWEGWEQSKFLKYAMRRRTEHGHFLTVHFMRGYMLGAERWRVIRLISAIAEFGSEQATLNWANAYAEKNGGWAE